MAAWMLPAAIMGSSVIGGLLGRGSKGQEQQSQTAPWVTQQLDIAQRASDLYGGDMRLPVWGGPYYAPAGSDMQASWDTLRGLAQGSPYVNTVWDQSRNLMGGNPFSAQFTPIGTPQTAGGMSATTIPGASQATQDIADTYWPTQNFLGMAREATAQSPGRTVAGAGGLSGTIPGIGNIGSARDLVGGVPTASLAAMLENPMFGMNNPYTKAAIDAAQEDTIEAYNENVMPQLDRLMQQSGSFGNTGVQEMQTDAARNFAEELGQIANDMRYKDLFAQQQMGEGRAGRGTAVSQSNAAAENALKSLGYSTGAQASMFDIGNDINRQRFNSELAANLGMFDINNVLNTQRFNAGNLQQADLANMGAINNMQQYGLDAVNRGEQFNAGQGNQIGLWNAGQTNDVAARNAAIQNAASLQNSQIGMWNAGQANDAATRNAAMANDMSRYNTGMDWNAYMTGMNNMPWLQQQAMLGGSLLGQIGTQQQANEQGMINEDLRQWQDVAMNPYNNLNMYAGLIGQLNGGFNSLSSQNYPGNPLMGAMGGAMLGNSFGNMMGGGQPSQYGNYTAYPSTNYGTLDPGSYTGWVGPW